MKFLLDENVPHSLYLHLKKGGHKVVRAQEIKRGLPDMELLRLARKNDMILVTLDKDFARLYFLDPGAIIVLIEVHPPFPDLVVDAFEELMKKARLLQSGGLIVVGRKEIKKIHIAP